MIHLHASGHLIQDPQTRSTKAGGSFVTGLVSVDDIVIAIAAFDAEISAILAQCRKGDGVSIAGKAVLGIFAGKDGTTKPSVQVTINRILVATGEALAKPRKPRGGAKTGLGGDFVDDED